MRPPIETGATHRMHVWRSFALRPPQNEAERTASASLPLAFGVGVFLLAQREADGRSRQIEGVAQAVDQIAAIGVRYGVGAAGEQNKARRARFRLGDVVEPDATVGHGRR